MRLTDGTEIGSTSKPYIIAEVNSSHNGNEETAKQMIVAAAMSGCNCIKFQSWSADSLYSRSYYDQNPIAKRFVNKFSFNEAQLAEMARFCNDHGIGFSSTPYSNAEVDFLVKCKVPFIKIASMELNNHEFLEYIARTGFPIILSTGMGYIEEVDKAIEVIEKTGNSNICLLHCISIYPAKPETINLNNITMLKKRYPQYSIGFSDHSIGSELASAAVALGASVIEKHLTLDKTKIGMDNQMATEPKEMEELVTQCNNVYLSLGSHERIVSSVELTQRKTMRRSLVYARTIKAGEVLLESDIIAKRPGTGFPPTQKKLIIGKKLCRDVEYDTLISEEDF